MLLLIRSFILLILMSVSLVVHALHSYQTGSSKEDLTQVSGHSVSQSIKWQRIAESQARWLWLDLYKATLYRDSVNQRVALQNLLEDSVPLKLELCYQQAIKASQIIEAAESNLVEVEDALLNAAVKQLHDVYQNVVPGDCYSLQHNQAGYTSLWLNGKLVFESDLLGFKKLYFGIWLGETPISESLKQELIGDLS